MFSRVLVKLVDQAILPAVALLAARIISIVVVANYFDYEFAFENFNFVFESMDKYVTVNSYSTLVMALVIFAGLLFVIIKSYVLHDSHITPKLTAKLFTFKVPFLIKNSFEIYTKAIVWLSYSYLVSIICGIMVYFDQIYSWIFYICLLITLVSTVLIVLDFEKELNIKKLKSAIFDTDKSFLEKFK